MTMVSELQLAQEKIHVLIELLTERQLDEIIPVLEEIDAKSDIIVTSSSVMPNKELLAKAVEILYQTDGYSAADLNKIFEAIRLLQRLQLPDEEIIEHDPTKEETEILQVFDAEFFELCNRYLGENLRREVLDAAVLSNAQVWQSYENDMTEWYEGENDDE